MTTATLLPASTLPVQLTGFVGRDLELATLLRLISGTRLLTLTGAGGSGKTRLALATVARIREAGDAEVAWVELASLADAGSLAAHLAVALGVRAEGGGSAEQALVALLRDRRLLLVLDNCEHLVDECARIVELLLHACPSLRVLATSRQALGISGERSWLVPALSLPADRATLTPGEAAGSEAVRLFVERAQDVVTTFALTAANTLAVARICRRLDGLPLAIELAAARVGVLTPEQIATRLDDRFGLLTSGPRSALPRHRTLRAAVDWSYDLLSGPEQVLLERLSVFAGGFTLDAAEFVCTCEQIPESGVLDLLASLATRSLVAMQEENGKARYRLLETIREYAADRRRLRADAGDIAERHARYFLALARDLEAEVILARPACLHLMDMEHDNFLAALAWSAAGRMGARYGLPLGWSLMWYWLHRQRWHEGFRNLEAALQTAVDPDPQLRAAALHGLGLFGLYALNPLSRARLGEAAGIWRATGNPRWLTFTLLVQTIEASLRQAPVEARAFADEAITVARTLSDPWDAALVTAHALVPVLVWEQDWHAAERHLIEAERVYRAREYTIGVAYVLDARAFVALQLGDRRLAVSLARASLRESPQAENRWLAGRSLRILGAAAFAQGELARAARLFGAAEGMYEAIGAQALTMERRAVNEMPERLQVVMPAEAFNAEWETGRAYSFDAALAFALDGTSDEGYAAAASDSPFDSAGTASEAANPAPGSQPDSLTVNALGTLEILRAGRPVPADAWRHSRPRELLLYLLAQPEGRTREQIGLDFWPDASAAQVKNNFHVTLHHLRKAVGRAELILHEQGRYRVDAAAGVEFDATRFEQLAGRALRRLRKAAPRGLAEDSVDEAARVLDEVLTSYRGPFLQGEVAGDWHLAIRERLARLHLDALQALGTYREARGENGIAAAHYMQLVAADSLHEDGVRGLMRALARDGRRTEALRAFERFEKELATELDSAPDDESQQLAARIRRGDAI